MTLYSTMPLSGAERQRRYLQKLKDKNPVKLEEIKRKNLEQTKKNYKKANDLNKSELDLQRQKWRRQKRDRNVKEVSKELQINEDKEKYSWQQVDVGKYTTRPSTPHYGDGTTLLDPLTDEHLDIPDKNVGAMVKHIKTEETEVGETILKENYDVYSFAQYMVSLLEKLPRQLRKTVQNDIVNLIENVIDKYQTKEKNHTSLIDHSSDLNATEETVSMEDNSQIRDTPTSPSITNVDENMMEKNLCDYITDDEECVNDDVINNDKNNLKRKYSGIHTTCESKSAEKLEIFDESLPELCQRKVARIPVLDTKNGDGDVISVENIKTEEIGVRETTSIENCDDVYSYGQYVASLLETLPRHICRTLQHDIVYLIKNVIVNYQTNEKSNTSGNVTKEKETGNASSLSNVDHNYL